jgi:hypothetical protein
MKREILLLSVLVLVMGVSISQGQETEKGKLGVTLDVTYMSKCMCKGSESYGQQGALLKTIDLDFWGTGFGAAVKHRNATSSGYVDKQKFYYKVYYAGRFFEDKAYLTKYKIRWQYGHYPGLARNKAKTTQEWKFAFSWPEILPAGLVPKYVAYYEYPAGSGYLRRDVTGWVHLFGLGYDLKVSELSNPLHLSAEAAYRDGLGGGAVDHDWSHATFGISTKFKINDNLSFIPRLYHQISMDDSVCKRDVTYCVLSMKYKF